MDRMAILLRFRETFRVHLVCEYPHAQHVLPLHEHEGYKVSTGSHLLKNYIENVVYAVAFLSKSSCFDSLVDKVSGSLGLDNYYFGLLDWVVKENDALKTRVKSVNANFKKNATNLLKEFNDGEKIANLKTILNADQQSFKMKDKGGMKCVSTRNGVKYLCYDHYQEYCECKLF